MQTARQYISIRKSTLAMALLALSAPVFAAKINPGEILEDTVSQDPAEIQWPEKEFPDQANGNKVFKPGESFQFRAQWGLFRKAGQLKISTEAIKIADTDKLLVTTDTRSSGLIRALYPMWLKGKTVLDTSNGRMLENRVTGKARSDETDIESIFDYESKLMNHTDKRRPERNAVKDLPYPFPLDYSCSILQIRSWDLTEGSRHPLFVSTRGKFYLIEMETKRIETISTKFGKIEAYRVEPVSAFPQSKIFREGGKMAIWISSDKRRIPLRLDVKTSIGTASMKLEAFTLSDEPLVAQTR